MRAISRFGPDQRAYGIVTAAIVQYTPLLWYTFARGLPVAVAAFLGGALASTIFTKLNASWLGVLSLSAVTSLAGFTCGFLSKQHSFWLCAHVALAYWVGEMVAVGTAVSLGDTTRQFVLSLLALNCCPLLAGSAAVPGTLVAQRRLQRQASPTLGA
jgi:hypothetical protein